MDMEMTYEEKLKELHESYLGFLRTRNAEWTQKMFNSFTRLTGNSLGSWSCGGCLRRTKEKTEYILMQAGLIEKVPS